MRHAAVVIGGGIHGVKTALALRKAGVKKVVLIERNARLMQEASRVNQSRIHRGYHYPRSLETARAMNESFDRFCIDHWYAVTPMNQIYAIAAEGSKVTPAQFEEFCTDAGLPINRVETGLFAPGRVAAEYQAWEAVIDANLLEMAFTEQLATAGVEVVLGDAAQIGPMGTDRVGVFTASGRTFEAEYVFDVTYSSLKCRTPIKLGHCEIVLIPEPPMLKGQAVLVLDGAFWSVAPYPTSASWQLTHVTKMLHPDQEASDGSHAEEMLAAAEEFIPGLGKPAWHRSIYMTRAVIDDPATDSRPSLWEYDSVTPRIIHILGGKLSGIYDIERMVEQWVRR